MFRLLTILFLCPSLLITHILSFSTFSEESMTYVDQDPFTDPFVPLFNYFLDGALA